MQRDSISYIFTVAGAVCAVCALLVSAAAIGLKPQQEKWVQIDTQRNILFAAAADDEERTKFKKMSGQEVSDFFAANFRNIVVDLATGEEVTDQYQGRLAQYRQIEAAELRKKDQYTDIPLELDYGQIKRRENHSHVYLRTDSTKRYVFPVRGKGLWSTLKGFVALQPDLKTAAYLTFYSHAETPGLGGEVDNAGWKARWNGKVVLDDQGKVVLTVVKGDSATESQVDGLSGATITSKGVENMMRYWMGEQGFGPYLRRIRQETL
ncbi:MAG: Na(+)-translocating NADH-quinone reductase subunit C [Planctomycetaceae bacterium]|nr:Na(+)-translocating NADH-quinone reductase subunit C [Planctomycetaceae bacterium]